MPRTARRRSASAMICLALAGCGGAATGPTADESRAHPRTGGADRPPTGDDRPTATDSRFNPLSAEEARVILGKGTERPFTGLYTDLKDPGTFTCRHPRGKATARDQITKPPRWGGRRPGP
jgi:hypothetical protein